MQVRDVMKTNIITIAKGTTCSEAAKVLLENVLSGAPVVDAEGKLIGIVSEKDLFRAMFPDYRDFYESMDSVMNYEELESAANASSDKAVEHVMTTRLIVARPDTPIVKIGAQMVASGIHRIPVTEGDKIVGMVSRGDIYRAILRKYFGLEGVAEKRK